MKIVINNDLKFLRTVYDEINKFCVDNYIDDTTKFTLNLIVEEYITNIINHGAIEGKEHTIEIEIEKKDEQIFAKITDDASEFNPLEASLPDLDKKMEEKIPGGLGLLLIIEKAENKKYYRENNKNNFEFTLTFN